MNGDCSRSRNGMNGRPSIGLVLASLHTGASLAAWPGVARAAERAGVNLFCFPGGRLGLREGYEASRNAIYDLAALAPLDGALVWSSSLCGTAEIGASLDCFMDSYRDIPVASLSEGVAGLPIVTFDYYGGMREAVLHAARAHGYRRIAFIQGPAGHPGAKERRRAFVDSLRELSIEADPRLSTSPFPWDSGKEAAMELLDARGLVPGRDFEALIASSDLLALAAMREIQSRGFRVPEDVAVLGMNNGIESRIAAPPLTTVDCPFAELGAIGLQTLLDLVASRAEGRADTEAAPTLRLEAKLVIRRSCGCPVRAIGREGGSLEEAIATETGLEKELTRDWVAPLVEAWEDIARGGGDGRFLDLLGRVLDRAARAGMDLSAWQGAISLLRREALDSVPASGRDAIEEAAGQARVLVAEAAERAHEFRAWESDRVDLKLRELDHELIMARDARRIGEILRDALPSLGIRSAYLCRYEGDGTASGREAGEASLVAGFRDEEGLSASSATFRAAELLPRTAFPDRRLSYVVEPLFFHDSQIGYALFEIGDATGATYERLRDSVSDALRSLLLFERAEAARERSERADGIKTRLLTNVTHELRAPVDMILLGAARLLGRGPELGLGPEAVAELERITQGAEHERRLVGDLLDFSRAELDQLDVHRSPVDPGEAIREAFALFAPRAREGVEWRLDLPERLPVVMADPFRLKQVLMNLLSNAEKFTRAGSVTVSARAEPPDLAVRVSDTGPGIPPERLSHLFEPFVSSGSGGVGLGLSIARHIALLHFGSLEAESPPGGGAGFTLTLPLPDARSLVEEAEGPRPSAAAEACILLVSSSEAVPPEIAAAAAARGLPLRRVGLREAEEGGLDLVGAAAIAWDSSSPTAEELALFRRIRARPRLASLPFLLYGHERAAAAFVEKGSSAPRIAEALALALGDAGGGEGASIVAADDDAAALDRLRGLLAESFPGARIAAARDGNEAWKLLRERKPLLAVLDISMPGMTGIEVVKRMRADDRLRAVPAILLTSKVISMDDVRAVEGSSRVVLRNKGILTSEAAAAEAARVASGRGGLPGATSDIVKRAVAFINERYSSALTRWQLAEAVNVSEDYLSRVFRQELGITPWEYLTRLRIERAKELLAAGTESVATVGARVGFPDQAYFSRVFKKIVGAAPQAYRDSPD